MEVSTSRHLLHLHPHHTNPYGTVLGLESVRAATSQEISGQRYRVSITTFPIDKQTICYFALKKKKEKSEFRLRTDSEKQGQNAVF